jgi:hypothetical protein
LVVALAKTPVGIKERTYTAAQAGNLVKEAEGCPVTNRGCDTAPLVRRR